MNSRLRGKDPCEKDPCESVLVPSPARAGAAEQGQVEHSQVVGLDGIPGQGPHMLIVLRVASGVIAEARYSTYGCPVAAACGQFVTEQVEGKTVQEAARMDAASIIAGLGQMPLGREHCPALAVNALRHALSQLQ